MKLSTKSHKILDNLNELFNQQHGGCDDNTCTTMKAMEAGYSVLAISCFASSGAPNDEFYRLFNSIPSKQLHPQLISETKEFLRDPDYQAIECSHNCGAYIYNTEFSGNKYYCDNCGKINKKAIK